MRIAGMVLAKKHIGPEKWVRGLLSQCVPLFLFFLALFWKLTTSPEATSTTYARKLLLS